MIRFDFYLKTKVLVFCTLLPLVLTSELRAADEWPMFKSDMAHSSVAPTDTLSTPFVLKWTDSAAPLGSNNAVAYSSPVALNGKTYIGCIDGNLYAFNIGSGSLIWKYKTDGLIYGSPAVATISGNDYVFIGSTDGNLYGINASSGALVCKQAVGGPVFSSPLVVTEGSNTVVICAAHSGVLSAFNVTNPTSTVSYWPAPIALSNNYLFASPAYDSTNDLVDEPCYDGNLYAVHVSGSQAGQVAWTAAVGPTRSTPAVTANYLYNFSNNGTLMGLMKNNGSTKVTMTITGMNAAASPAAYSTGTTDTIITAGLNGIIQQWQFTGSGNFNPQWSQTLPNSVYSSPAVSTSSNVLFVGCNDKNLYTLNLANGNILSTTPMGKTVQVSPAVAEGNLLISSSSGNFQAFAAPTPTPGTCSLNNLSWSSLHTMPTSRDRFGVGAVNGIIYAVGGQTSGGVNNLTTVESYNPSTNSWTPGLPSMPTGRDNLAVATVNDSLYAIGGYNGTSVLNTVEAYNTTTNAWSTMTSMPTARCNLSVGVVNGIIYAMGGNNSSGNLLTTVESYNPSTNTWTPNLPPMPTALSQFSVGAINGILYVAGGDEATGFNASPPIVNNFESYNPSTNTWNTNLPTMITGRCSTSSGVMNGLFYVAGGSTNTTNNNTVEAYDPVANAWSSKASMPSVATAQGGCLVNNVLYAIGGWSGSTFMNNTQAGALVCLTSTPTSSPTSTPTPSAVAWTQPANTLSGPRGVVIDYLRNVGYVADGNSVKTFNLYTGSMLGTVGAGGQFGSPQGIAMGGDGYLYVANYSAGTWQKVDPVSGNILATIGASDNLGTVRGIWVDTNGDVYLTSTGFTNSLVRYVYNPPASCGAAPTYTKVTLTLGGSALNTPTGIAKVGVRLFVADSSNNRAVMYKETTTGSNNYDQATVLSTGSFGFSVPQELTADLAGNVYVTSYSNSGYMVYSSTGSLLTSSQNSAYGNPFGIGVDTAGSVYLSNNGSLQLLKIVSGSQTEPAYLTPTPTPTCATSTPTPTQISNLWSEATASAGFSAREGQASVYFNNLLWVIGGQDSNGPENDVWYSPDGVNWHLATANAKFPVRAFHQALVFNNLMWVIGGANLSNLLNDVWSSPDGVNWTQATGGPFFPARVSFGALVYNGAMWVMGGSADASGYLGDVWTSANGSSWSQVTVSQGFGQLASFGCATFNNQMWILGGTTSNNPAANIYSSTNGSSWSLQTTTGFPALMQESVLAYGGQIFTVGGDLTTGATANVYASPDGIHWNLSNGSPGFTARYASSSAVAFNQMWMMGGGNTNGNFNDVWYSPFNATPTNTPSSPTPTLTATPTPTTDCPAVATWTASDPMGLALDANNNVYVTDDDADNVDIFNASGLVSQFGVQGPQNGQFNSPEGIALSAEGNIYVADSGNNRVQVFDSQGNYLRQWGSEGTGNGQFEYPVGIAINPAGVYVVDSDNARVQVFDHQGHYFSQWGSPGTGGNGNFETPWDIAMDANGLLYVTDYTTSLVQVFNGQGQWQRQWNPTTSGNLESAESIWVANNGLVYLSDGFGAVGIFDVNGNPLGYTTGSNSYFNGPEGVAVSGSGNNWFVADSGNGMVEEYGNCPLVASSPVPTPTPVASPICLAQSIGQGQPGGNANGQFQSMSGVAVDPVNGYIYASDPGNNRIQQFNFAGNFLNAWGTSGAGNVQFNNPQDLALDPSGNLYVADTGNNRIQVLTSSGGFVKAIGTPGAGNGQFTAPSGVAVDSLGNLYVVDSGNSRIEKFNSSGTYQIQWNYDSNTAWNHVAVDDIPYVYVTDGTDHLVKKYSQSGVLQAQWGSYGGGAGQFLGVNGIAIGPCGWVYVTDAGNSRVSMFDTLGNFRSMQSGLNVPYQPAFDGSGNLYTSSASNLQVFKYSPCGIPCVITTPTPTPTPLSGPSWVEVTSSAPFSGRYEDAAAYFNNKMWVIGGTTANGSLSDIWSSPDGVNWTQVTANAAFGTRSGHQLLAYNNKLWLIGGGSGSTDVWSSPDGVNWTQTTSSPAFGTRTGMGALVYNNLMWVIGGANGSSLFNDVWSSPDGANWTRATSGAAFPARSLPGCLVFNNKMWVVCGAGSSSSLGDVWNSTDGVNWTQVPASGLSGRAGFACFVYNGQMVLAAGYGFAPGGGGTVNSINASPDGANWSTGGMPFGPRTFPAGLTALNKMWVIGGGVSSAYSNDVWSGANIPASPTPTPYPWSQVGSGVFTGRQGHSEVYFNGQYWIIGGQDSTGPKNDIWYSSDSVNWKTVTTTAGAIFPPRRDQQVLVYDNKMWVIGGFNPSTSTYYSDVWSSSDGIHWTQATANAAFGLRSSMGAVVYDGKMWVIGGANNIQVLNDVWSSFDGVNWTQATANAAFKQRDFFGCAVFGGRMWVMGGNGGPSGLLFDSWVSADGVNWTQAANIPYAFSWVTAWVYNSQLYLLGSTGTGNGNWGAVCVSPDGWTWNYGISTFGNKMDCSALSANNSVWVVGGLEPALTPGPYGNDIWVSPPLGAPTNTPTYLPTNTPTGTLSPTLTPTTTSTAVSSVWRVVAGRSSSYKDSQGNVWFADENFSGGSTDGTGNGISNASPSSSDQALYQTERYGDFYYTFNVPPGMYQVTLKFAEISSSVTASRDRIFNYYINNAPSQINFDIYNEVGQYKADDKVYNNISPNAAGQIVIHFANGLVNNAKVSAIQIVPQTRTGPCEQYALSWNNSAVTPINNVSDVETDNQNQLVYESEWTGDRIQVFDYNGNYQRAFNLGTPLNGIKLGPGGLLYVVESSANQVVGLNPSTGIVTTTFGSGSLNLPIALAFDASGSAYVGNLNGSNVSKFTQSWGTFSFASNVGGGILSGAEGVAVDGSGNLYVGDSGNHRIEVFNSAGVPTASWGTGLFTQDIQDIRIDTNQFLWASDREGNRVLVFDMNGGQLAEAIGPTVGSQTLSGATGLALGSGGQLYVGEYNNSRIDRLNPCAGTSTPTPTPTPRPTPCFQYAMTWNNSAVRTINGVSSVAVDNQNQLVYESEWAGSYVQEFDFSGNYQKGFNLGVNLNGIKLGPSGLLYVVENNNQVISLNPTNGNTATVIPSGTLGAGPSELAFDANGNLYVNDYGNNQVVEFSAPNYTTVANKIGPTVGTLTISAPEAVAVDTQGNLYVADTGNHRIDVFYANGAVAAWGTGLFTQDIMGLAIDSNNFLWASDRQGNRMLVFDLNNGQWVETVGPTVGPTSFNNPTGLAFAWSGQLYVGDFNNNRIVRLNPCPGSSGERPLSGSASEEGSRTSPTPTPSSVITETPTPTSTPNSSSWVVAAPNVSRNGETIKFLVNLDKPENVEVTVFNLSGEKVFDESAQGTSGWNSLPWNLENKLGEQVASGLYIYVLTANDGAATITQRGKLAVLH